MRILRRAVMAVVAVGLLLAGGAAAAHRGAPTGDSAACVAIDANYDKLALAKTSQAQAAIQERNESAALAANHCTLDEDDGGVTSTTYNPLARQ